MGTAAEKQKLRGMSPTKTRKRMMEIWAEKHATPLMKVSRNFEAEHGISLLAVCEMWHSLRSKNAAIEAMIISFAGTVASKNALIGKLSNTIHLQREELGKRLREIDGLKSDHLQTDGGHGPTPSGASSSDEL